VLMVDVVVSMVDGGYAWWWGGEKCEITQISSNTELSPRFVVVISIGCKSYRHSLSLEVALFYVSSSFQYSRGGFFLKR
jgi:hypothetical protein